MPQIAIAIVLGTLLAFYGNELPDRLWSAYTPILLLLAGCCKSHRFLLLATAAYLWGCAAFHYHLEHRLNSAFDHRPALVQGIVSDIPVVANGYIRLQLKITDIGDYPGRQPRLARLNWYQDRQIPQAGEHWQFLVKLRQPRGQLNPGGFDFEAWQFVRGIDTAGYIRNSKLNLRLQAASRLRVDYWRQLLLSKFDAQCPQCAQIGLLKALAIGYRGAVDRQHKNSLQASGTAHLLAISGLHIGMVAVFAFALGRICWRVGGYRTGLNRLQMASILASLAALVYAALAGFSLPTLRALVMLTIVLLALLSNQRVNLLQSLSLAAGLLLVVDPRIIAATSFWLSFSALLVIALAQFGLPSRLRWWRRLLWLQLYFSILFAPIGMVLFGQLNPAGLLANLVAIPLISFVVLPLVLLACLLLLLGAPGAAAPVLLANWLLGHLLTYLNFLLDSILPTLAAAHYPLLLLLSSLLAMVGLLLPRGLYLQRGAVVAVAVLLCWRPDRLDFGAFEVVVFDVGMGTSVGLRTRNHSLVYDLGPGKAEGFSAARRAMYPYLLQNGIEWPDLIVVSHVDQDHSGGLYAYLDKIVATQFVTGTPTAVQARFRLRYRPGSCHDYPDWRWDGVQFRFLDAVQDGMSNNDRSCVLIVNGVHRLLLPGDIEAARELQLVANYGATLAADLVVAPHHGSATSSSPTFLAQVHPEYAIFTLARANRWGFPEPRVQQAYQALGTRLLRTDSDGAITISSSASGLQVKVARQPVKRIWRRW